MPWGHLDRQAGLERAFRRVAYVHWALVLRRNPVVVDELDQQLQPGLLKDSEILQVSLILRIRPRPAPGLHTGDWGRHGGEGQFLRFTVAYSFGSAICTRGLHLDPGSGTPCVLGSSPTFSLLPQLWKQCLFLVSVPARAQAEAPAGHAGAGLTRACWLIFLALGPWPLCQLSLLVQKELLAWQPTQAFSSGPSFC